MEIELKLSTSIEVNLSVFEGDLKKVTEAIKSTISTQFEKITTSLEDMISEIEVRKDAILNEFIVYKILILTQKQPFPKL